MANIVSYGFVRSTEEQSKPATSAPNPTIEYSTVVGRNTWGQLKSTSSREVFHLHLVTRRRSSAV